MMLAGRYAALSGRSTRERQLGASHLSLEFADRVPGHGHKLKFTNDRFATPLNADRAFPPQQIRQRLAVTLGIAGPGALSVVSKPEIKSLPKL